MSFSMRIQFVVVYRRRKRERQTCMHTTMQSFQRTSHWWVSSCHDFHHDALLYVFK